MFNKVIVGVDGGAGGRDALTLARQLLATDGELIEANVRPLYPSSIDVRPPSEWDIPGSEQDDAGDAAAAGQNDAATAAVSAADAEATAADPQHPNRTVVISTSVGRGLHQIAEERGADLVVVGSTHHGVLGRVMVGDATREAINGAPCAVAVAPSGYAQQSVKLARVGVAYNASDESDHAVHVARQIAREHGAQLAAMEVVNFPSAAYIGIVVPVNDLAEPLLKEARERLNALGADVEPNASFGVAAEELTQFSGNVDLLVVGSRDFGPVGRLVHSSTSRDLARRSRCPLLILTRDARERARSGAGVAPASALASS